MKKFVYKNKKTKKIVITGEKLDRRQWEFIGERRNSKMYSNEVNQKNGR